MAATVYSYDAQTGEFVGTTIADESPEEPGKLIMPAFTTQKKPTKTPNGFKTYWRGSEWEHVRHEVEVPPPPPPMQPLNHEERVFRMHRIVQAMLDHAAQVLGYYDIITAITYAEEPAVPKYQLEGQRLRRLRSMVWAETHRMIDKIKDGDDWPSDEDFLSRLPKYDEMEQWEEPEPNPVQKPQPFPTQKKPHKPEPGQMD